MKKIEDFKVKFWGVRGSYPVANKDFLKYGGNTACVEVTVGGHRIILDGGTGIIPLGDKIFKEHISSSEDVFNRTPMNVLVLLPFFLHFFLFTFLSFLVTFLFFLSLIVYFFVLSYCTS